ncbi:hypothetical protein EHZ19_12760 [Paraburkholderia bannensis]|nr:hypothetical protein EHZ19_12760 [Paraburkholderia bannensis]
MCRCRESRASWRAPRRRDRARPPDGRAARTSARAAPRRRPDRAPCRRARPDAPSGAPRATARRARACPRQRAWTPR